MILGWKKKPLASLSFAFIHKDWYKTKERVGGTKTINIENIRLLKPDLIIANKEENVKEQIEALAADYPVWLTDVNNLADALQMIADIGRLTGKMERSDRMVNEITLNFEKLAQQQTTNHKLQTAYLIWQKPYMTVGGDTFINDMLHKCGFENIFSGKTRYPEIDIAQLQTENCQLLLLSSEPYPFKQKQIDELSYQLPGIKIILADGEFFSWYGSRMLQSPAYFKQLITQIQGW